MAFLLPTAGMPLSILLFFLWFARGAAGESTMLFVMSVVSEMFKLLVNVVI